MEGKHVVIVGRSNIVGLPLFHLMNKQNATVTLCHSHTRNLRDFTRQADILVVAVGSPHLVKGEEVKEGAVVVDVGISGGNGGVVGDVEFQSVGNIASALTPVPGGVGPVTVAMMAKNLWTAARINAGSINTHQKIQT
jgi:methylenetetrahydrofolate dehydrogenase (NADP+) / methenyltetrahydrofolate cyclohydrolase